MRPASAALAVLILALGTVGSCQAQSGQNVAVIAAACTGCHGAAVSPGAGAIPAIAGLDASALSERMRGFKQAGAEVTVMNRITKAYSDEEIDALAHYFAARR